MRNSHKLNVWLVALVVGISIGLPFVHPASAQTQTLIVTKLEDTDDGICDSDCSLREAVKVSANFTTIRFRDGLKGILYLNTPLIISDKKLYIFGDEKNFSNISLQTQGGNAAIFGIYQSSILLVGMELNAHHPIDLKDSSLVLDKVVILDYYSDAIRSMNSNLFILNSIFYNNLESSDKAIEFFFGKESTEFYIFNTAIIHKDLGSILIEIRNDSPRLPKVFIEMSTIAKSVELFDTPTLSVLSTQIYMKNTLIQGGCSFSRNEHHNRLHRAIDNGGNYQFISAINYTPSHSSIDQTQCILLSSTPNLVKSNIVASVVSTAPFSITIAADLSSQQSVSPSGCSIVKRSDAAFNVERIPTNDCPIGATVSQLP
jgi:CSLREA domain-containing protein